MMSYTENVVLLSSSLYSCSDFKVLGMPAPSSGPVVSLMLNMMEGFDWQENSDLSPQTYHQMIEVRT